jgi:hypothetical protein
MKPYMSYWSGGYRKIPEQYIINLHKISAHYLKQNFGEVHFITDDISLPYFKDINFSSVAIEFNNIPKEYGVAWSISKLLAYKIIAQKKDPFIHVDYDVILWEGLEDRLKKADVFAQSIEKRVDRRYEIEKFKANCPNLHLIGKLDISDAVNVGIIGGNDLEFLYNYSNSALELILDPVNKDFWLNYRGFFNTWNKAAIPEQYYLTVYAEYYNKKIETLFDKERPTLAQAKEKKYSHLLREKDDEEYKHKIQLMVNQLGL